MALARVTPARTAAPPVTTGVVAAVVVVIVIAAVVVTVLARSAVIAATIATAVTCKLESTCGSAARRPRRCGLDLPMLCE